MYFRGAAPAALTFLSVALSLQKVGHLIQHVSFTLKGCTLLFRVLFMSFDSGQFSVALITPATLARKSRRFAE